MLKSRTRQLLVFFAISLLFFSTQAVAGIVVERIHADAVSPTKAKVEKVITYIQKNKVKTVGPEGDYTIIDLTNGTMTMV
ncbi:MAG: hypothetical protein GXO58_08870, partial [Thermodesulfobacteria bacterium]|nr:hypothetical protein [Thermodesulfobacteriota bacterium]